MGGSDPAYPVYYKNAKITRTKNGYFSVYDTLATGKNSFIFTQNGANVTHVINKGKTAAGPPSEYVYPQMDGYKISITSPSADTLAVPGSGIQIRVQAPSNSTVTAKLGGASVILKALTLPPNEGKYMTEVYSGTINLPNTQPNGTLIDLGNLTITAARNAGEYAEVTGINIKLINESVYGACEVIKDNAMLQRAITGDLSGFYNGYLSASVGMRDNITEYTDGYYKLRFGGYIAAANVKLLTGTTLAVNKIQSAVMENKGEVTEIKFGVTENVPVDAKGKDGVFNITLYNTPDGGVPLTVTDNPLFNRLFIYTDKTNNSVTYSLDLTEPENFYGFELIYENGFIIIRARNPMKKIEGEKPLAGLDIIVDAGHGGNDPGALGFLGAKGKTEDDLNLEISLALRDKLTAMGANVIMVRDTDTAVDIYARMDMLNEINPDLCVSIHHNSLGDGSDNSRTRGVLPLYCNESGRLLSRMIGHETALELNRAERESKYQNLAMLRNHKFAAMLIEMSFLTNPDEYDAATLPSTVQRSADGIANGILAWINAQAEFAE
jgi:N-acetylmuramoyl-L-alanine amidase